MFQAGDQVIYGMHGVCCVVALEERVIDRKRLTYLALEPVGQDGSRFLVPTHNSTAMAKLQRMLTPGQLTELFASPEIRENGWIRDENQRKQTYRELINSGDRRKLMKMVRALYRHKTELTASGKKIHQCDDNFLRDAEKLLSGEVAVVLGMEYDQARAYLREQLNRE